MGAVEIDRVNGTAKTFLSKVFDLPQLNNLRYLVKKIMKENIVKSKSFDFAVMIVHAVEHLQENREYVMSKQLLRSGTSVGSNIRESEFASSKRDFIYKLTIALKEANETEYWIELLYRANRLSQAQFLELQTKTKELLKILTSIINTTKRSLNHEKNNQL